MWSLRIGGAERALYQLVLAQRLSGAEVGVLVATEPGLYGGAFSPTRALPSRRCARKTGISSWQSLGPGRSSTGGRSFISTSQSRL